LYQLEYHLPFFAMRRNSCGQKESALNPQRDWIDLSYIARILPESFPRGKLGIYPAQISVAICGTSAKQYIVYGFEDTHFDPDREFGEDEFSLDEVHPDQISNSKGGIDANLPVCRWNPREYFLATLVYRVRQVQEEWEQLVRTLRTASERCSSYSLGWNESMLRLLRRLLPVLEDILAVWNDFIASDGDINYFTDLTSAPCGPKVQAMLQDVHERFKELGRFHNILLRLQTQCEKEQSSAETRMMLLSNRNADLMIVCICPVSVVSSFFAIETPVIAFKRNALSFFGLTFLLMAVVLFLRLVMAWRICRPQWSNNVATWVKGRLRDARANTKKSAAGNTVIKRRKTVSWDKKSR
jgi:hypothetical protein